MAPALRPDQTPRLEADGERLYSVQQVAAITGMSEHNLRYYERAGLLCPVRRHEKSGHRRYTQSDITRIENLACLRATGMPLEQMRQYVEDREHLEEQVARRQIALFEAHREVLQERRAQIESNLRYVELKVAYWRAVEESDEAAIARCSASIREYIRDNAPASGAKKQP